MASARISGVENLPTLSSEWYVPPGASSGAASASTRSQSSGEGFDPLNGRHRVRRRRRSQRSRGSEDGGEMGDAEDYSSSSGESESESGGGSDSESGSDSDSDSEDEFFEASTDVQRKWRRLSLTSPNAPFEDTPDPSSSSCSHGHHRQRAAQTSAQYYSEAYLTGIPPTHADAAARDVDGHKRWWTALQATKRTIQDGTLDVQDGSEHGSESSGAEGAAERGGDDDGNDELGGWSHHGDAAVTAAVVPELKPFALPTVESIFGSASTAPIPFNHRGEDPMSSQGLGRGFDGSLHSVGLGMKRTIDARVGLGRDQDQDQDRQGPSQDAPSMEASSTGASTPTGRDGSSSRGDSSSGAGSVGGRSEIEAEDDLPLAGADVFDDAASSASEGAVTVSSRSSKSAASSEDEEKGSFGGSVPRKKKRSRKYSRFSTAIQDLPDQDKDRDPPSPLKDLDYKEFPETTVVAADQTSKMHGSIDMTQLEHLDALRARVCSPEVPELDTAPHQLSETEFQDCLEDHAFDELNHGSGGLCEPVVDPFDEDEECCAVDADMDSSSQVTLHPDQHRQGNTAHQGRGRRRRTASNFSPRGRRGGRSPRNSHSSAMFDDEGGGCRPLADDCAPRAAQAQGAPPRLAAGLSPCSPSSPHMSPLEVVHRRRISDCKTALLRHLSSSGGDVTNPAFLASLSQLRGLAAQAGMDVVDYASDASRALEGMWLTLSRPNYHDCLGKNTHRVGRGGAGAGAGAGAEGEYMYTLGRMSFDMFRPTNLVCSVQGVFNPCHRVDGRKREEVDSVPRGLRREIEDGETCLRTYNIVTAFTIETPPSPSSTSGSDPSDASKSPPAPDLSGNSRVSRPIRGIQTTYGYVLPDPQTPNRLSVWFTGGTLECNDPEGDGGEWRSVFCGGDDVAEGCDSSSASSGSSSSSASGGQGGAPSSLAGALPARRHLSERARVLAAKLLLGAAVPDRMEDDGTMSYRFSRPIGGHGTTYIDVIYLDDTLRVLRGHHGTVYVFARVPGATSEEE